jgi:hypothetical protein
MTQTHPNPAELPLRPQRSPRSMIHLAGAALALLLAGLAGGAHASQCVKNEGGYVANVRWFKPGDINIQAVGRALQLSPKEQARVVQEDNIPIGRQSCAASGQERYTAVVSVVGGKYVDVALITLTAMVATGSAVLCPETGGATCAAAVLATGALAGGQSLIPTSTGLFYVDYPPSDKTLVLRGVTMKPTLDYEGNAEALKCTVSTFGQACMDRGQAGTCGITAGSGDCIIGVDTKDPAYSRVCNSNNKGQACYQGQKRGTCGMAGVVGDCKPN